MTKEKIKKDLQFLEGDVEGLPKGLKGRTALLKKIKKQLNDVDKPNTTVIIGKLYLKDSKKTYDKIAGTEG